MTWVSSRPYDANSVVLDEANYPGWQWLGWSYFIASVMRKSDAITPQPSSRPHLCGVSSAYGAGSSATSFLSNVWNTIGATPFNVGWTRTPAGWKRQRTSLSYGNTQYAPMLQNKGLIVAAYASHNGISVGSYPTRKGLAWCDNPGVYGDTGKDVWFSSLPVAGQTWNATMDLSFLDMPGLIPTGCKANKAYRMYLLMCCFWFDNPASYNQGCFMGDGTANDAQGLTVNLRTGSLSALDPEAAQSDTVVATFVLGSSDFSIPDVLGKFFLSTTKSATVLASGTVTYAEILGGSRADGLGPDGRCKLYIPVAEIPALNGIAVDRKTVTAGQSISIYDFGLQYKVGD